ncbi:MULTISPECIES: carboxymuconolactone decarboxylase family protein [unclassified Mesorhizobium]|uniref:carboxymuconolactone decarboxylase family protein n=1 Tax=unclassified Mesorhizobium TaxID=325217 RepID=UPI00241568C6|nr:MULTISPECIES: carboxymuconolactone decarboxylase family protein [unclassified Mesorhizobium]MDG4854841.1 carboxymuconolactone decarboxylase family protein [Mesorhizobium sp. WSM4982]MDG4914042.1 carboxymuconolactone decarboxylase family protein [Mesorhizobium sp. WSM4983]
MPVIRIISSAHSCLRSASLLAAIAFTAALTMPAGADDYDAAIKDIQSTIGGVPGFMKQFPKAGLPGAWAEVKAIELSDKTALPPKVKSLISLAVAAQIPCNYCVWSDTENAKRAGATDEEIQEAVALAALTRHWSTIFNGMQVDFAQFKKEMGGE